MANKKKTTKKKVIKKKPVAPPKPRGLKVYFVTEEVRSFLLEYLQLSPGGQYSPAAINAARDAIQNAASGHLGSDAS